jgi:ribosome modulation factor
MTKVETVERGYDAYWEGVDVADNPYDPADEPDEHKVWEDGWREARKHDHDERDW